MEFRSNDADFSVSWLIGLKPYKFIPYCPKWARQFQTEDPSFSVSWLLGIRPAPRRLRRGGRRQAWRRQVNQSKDEDVGEASDDETEVQEQSDEEEEDYGLRRMFGELPKEEEEQTEDEGGESAGSNNASEQASAEPAVLTDPSFLELCKDMEEMLDSIECVTPLLDLCCLLMWGIGNLQRLIPTTMNPSMACHQKTARTSPLLG